MLSTLSAVDGAVGGLGVVPRSEVAEARGGNPAHPLWRAGVWQAALGEVTGRPPKGNPCGISFLRNTVYDTV